MGRWVVEQPDGRLAVFSTIVDRFVCVDMTDHQVVSEYEERALSAARDAAASAIDRARNGPVLTYDEALETHLRTIAEEDAE